MSALNNSFLENVPSLACGEKIVKTHVQSDGVAET